MNRTVRFHETGGPDVLRLEPIEPPAPGHGEVRLRIRAIGLNRAEIMFRQGSYIQAPSLPSQLGYEAAGEIEALGPDVTAFAVGDRVSVIPAFDVDAYGLYGDVSLAPARALVAVPDGVDWADAAASWMQYGTAWGALVGVAGLKAGQTVLITAASSSVGLAAIQIANMLGARPIAVTRRSDKAEALKAAGAVAVIALEEQDVVSEVMGITQGRGADLVFDPVGGPAFPALLEALAIGALAIIYGALSDAVTPLPMLTVLVRDITIRSYGFAAVMQNDGQLREMKAFVTEGMRSGALRPVIARTFPLDEIVEAHRYLQSNAQVGKVVVLP
ncbi:zinc-dependent alcohol dehydrogenase family protein [Sphingomonas faeni]|uniref:zinc-dependent alcohol dehydrogenase family protein n=1 Tax=Sphingomonas faeni TaxID=185950 RepID=UPI00335EA941